MNPVFIILVLLGGTMLWLLCSFLFKPIGKVFQRLIYDAKEAMTEEEQNNEKGEESK